MMTDPGNGVYNLLVRNVTITDDALYQCQVSPGPAAGSKPIRSSATLSVLSEYHHRLTVVLSFILIHTHIRTVSNDNFNVPNNYWDFCLTESVQSEFLITLLTVRCQIINVVNTYIYIFINIYI